MTNYQKHISKICEYTDQSQQSQLPDDSVTLHHRTFLMKP